MAALAHPVVLLVGLSTVAVMTIFAAWVIALFAVPVFVIVVAELMVRRQRIEGRAVRPADEPELTALIRQVAERLDFRAPLLLRVVAEPQAGRPAGADRARRGGGRTDQPHLGAARSPVPARCPATRPTDGGVGARRREDQRLAGVVRLGHLDRPGRP